MFLHHSHPFLHSSHIHHNQSQSIPSTSSRFLIPSFLITSSSISSLPLPHPSSSSHPHRIFHNLHTLLTRPPLSAELRCPSSWKVLKGRTLRLWDVWWGRGRRSAPPPHSVCWGSSTPQTWRDSSPSPLSIRLRIRFVNKEGEL